jgi:ubiquinol-cytochrome c reductase iron-sulfur subunit
MKPGLAPDAPASRRTLAPVLTLLAAAIAAIAAVVAYWSGASTQVFGGLCALSLLLSGTGLAWWAAWGMPDELATEERGELTSTPEERAEFAQTFVRGGEAISRRRLLIGAVTAIVGAYAALGLSLLRSLAPDPYASLGHTTWSPDARVMTARGTALKPDDVRIDSVITVYPEGHLADPSAQTVLIRVNPSLLRLPPDQQSGVVDGILAFSKVCTHAGCPIGLYQAEQHVFLCPCHESTFDVLRGAVPVSGPATRALPQLPLKVDGQGYLAAEADYSTPVGPTFWNMPTGGE